MKLGRRKTTKFVTTPVKPQKLGPETSPWFWNPNMVGIKFAPADFAQKLKEVDLTGTVEVTWNAYRERWQVWQRDYRINQPICHGWRLLFVVELDNEYVPLDERTLAVLYERSGRKWGNLYRYWLQVEQRMEKEREKAVAKREDELNHHIGDYYDYMQIKNIGKGSKFADHLS